MTDIYSAIVESVEKNREKRIYFENDDSTFVIDPDVSKIIKEFLKINCPIDQAANKLNLFFKKNKINLRVQENYFPITKNKLSKLNIKFSSSFGRELEQRQGRTKFQ